MTYNTLQRLGEHMMNRKRPHHHDVHDPSPKRHHASDRNSSRPSHSHRDRDYDRSSYNSDRRDEDSRGGRKENGRGREFTTKRDLSHADAVTKLPRYAPDSKPHIMLPRDTHSLRDSTEAGLPALPSIKKEFQDAVFTHKSLYTVGRELAVNDVTYERLEFLGDAYLEVIASRIIFSHYPFLPAGRMSQLRQLLVKNETLAEYSQGYGFDKQVRIGLDLESLRRDGRRQGNKGWTKIMGDVLEAYVAAVVQSNIDGKGLETAEKWLTTLWAPKLLKAAGDDRVLTAMSLVGQAAAETDAVNIYDPEAKAKLQKRIMYGSSTKLIYEIDRPTIELKGDKKGENVHFIALYVESELLGIKRKLLAKAEGKNKVEAGNWAAIKAVYGPDRSFVDDMEEKIQAIRERRDLEKEARTSVKAEVAADEEVPHVKTPKVG